MSGFMPGDDVCIIGKEWTADNWNEAWKDPSNMFWVVIFGAFMMCFMAFGIGANDSANSWGTTVGSGAISLRQAMLVGGFMEILGAITLGYGVSTTIQKGVSDISDPYCWACGYCNSRMSLFMIAMAAALFGGAVFLLLATFTAMPVSTTHACVGAVVGATVVGTSFACLNWSWNGGLSAIVASWFLSPVLAGITGSLLYFVTLHTIINRKERAEKNAMLAFPILLGSTSAGLSLLILIKSKPFKNLHIGYKVLISITLGLLIGILTQIFVVPFVKSKIRENKQKSDEFFVTATFAESSVDEYPMELQNGMESRKQMSGPGQLDNDRDLDFVLEHESEEVKEIQSAKTDSSRFSEVSHSRDGRISAIYVFKYLLVYVAAWESFAHGANDTANATGAFAALLSTYKGGFSPSSCNIQSTPVWIMAVAGIFVFLGMNMLGRRVIETVGTNITDVNFHTGFCIEFASMSTVILASFLGLPVSSTHCQVGAVVFVGMAKNGPKKVSWNLFGKICLSWLLTLPLAALFAAALTSILSGTAKA